MTTKGFLTIAQNGKYDYVRMAYALAMSLKLTQKTNNKLSVIVNKDSEIPEKYRKVFDKVIPIDVPKEDWKIQNKWRYFELTPYDETIVLDTDMLFFHDYTIWWKILQNGPDINFTTSVRNYRGELITSDFYRLVFTLNQLPNVYTALFYFRKTKKVDDYFHWLQLIFENWKEAYGRLLKEPPDFLSGDIAYAIVAKTFLEEYGGNVLTFIHMRSKLQNENFFKPWNKELSSFFTTYHGPIELKVNNFNQIYPFHYLEKDFLTDEVIKLYEEKMLRLL